MGAAAARRFQAQLAENAKTLSVVFEAPEALHNLVETLDPQSLESHRPIALYLDDPAGAESERRLMSGIREVCQEAGIEGIPIMSQGEAPLERLFSLIHKSDWISWHLAALKGTDPVEIPIITALKEKLNASGTNGGSR